MAIRRRNVQRMPAASTKRIKKRAEHDKLSKNRYFWTPELLNQRLPTQVDWLLQGEKPRKALRNEKVRRSVELWKSNYLTAFLHALEESFTESLDSDTLDAVDELYWDLTEISDETFLRAMAKYPEELGFEAYYIKSHQDLQVARLISRWKEFL